MSLSDEQRDVVVSLEYKRALQILSQIDSLKQLGYWDTIANRLYYAVFHAACALLIHDGHLVKSHKGVVQVFGKEYVVQGIFSLEEGKLYSQLQTLRETSDYNCHFDVGPEIEAKIPQTIALIGHIGNYLGLNV